MVNNIKKKKKSTPFYISLKLIPICITEDEVPYSTNLIDNILSDPLGTAIVGIYLWRQVSYMIDTYLQPYRKVPSLKGPRKLIFLYSVSGDTVCSRDWN